MTGKTQPSGLTDAEQAALDTSAELWNQFLRLPQQHSDDVTEFRHKLHDLQRIIAARPSFRAMRKRT